MDVQIPPVFYRTSSPFGAEAQKEGGGHGKFHQVYAPARVNVGEPGCEFLRIELSFQHQNCPICYMRQYGPSDVIKLSRGLLKSFKMDQIMMIVSVFWRFSRPLQSHSQNTNPSFHLATSYLTRHTSHVTRHTSHVIRHKLHVSRHSWHVTCHTSHPEHQTMR